MSLELKPRFHKVSYTPRFKFTDDLCYRHFQEVPRLKEMLKFKYFYGTYLCEEKESSLSDTDTFNFLMIKPEEIAFCLDSAELDDNQKLWLTIRTLYTPQGNNLDDALTAYAAVSTIQTPSWHIEFVPRLIGKFNSVHTYQLVTIDAQLRRS